MIDMKIDKYYACFPLNSTFMRVCTEIVGNVKTSTHDMMCRSQMSWFVDTRSDRGPSLLFINKNSCLKDVQHEDIIRGI